ncbi:YciI family protein [Tenacibaculum sp. SDUM215027]|uniref:YciI family protein n=1 Tax=Tenacibaculum sp. SDUM215027 TaxID=3422596 RepID=UPI003D30F817
MKLLITTIIVLLSISLTAQNNNPNYDAELAKKLSADDYGMKGYVFAILKTGSNTSTDKELRSNAFRGHLNNINKLVKENKLVVAGPFEKNENSYRGLFIFNVKTIEEAKELIKTDPAIEAKYLDVDLYNWYGSAALSEYLKAADKIWKINP